MREKVVICTTFLIQKSTLHLQKSTVPTQMREKVVFCWPSRQKVEQCEGKVEQNTFG